jgi:hypothetical protein
MSSTLSTSVNGVTAQIKYSLPPTDGSQARSKTVEDPVTGKREKNYEVEEHEGVPIENIRGKENLYNLDTAGFQFHRRPTKLSTSDFLDENKVKGDYYTESIELIKEVTGAPRVVLFDHSKCFSRCNLVRS